MTRVAAIPRRATATPGRARALGVWAEARHGFAGARRSAEDVIEARHGFAGARPSAEDVIEARHGFAGPRGALGVWGPFRGPQFNR